MNQKPTIFLGPPYAPHPKPQLFGNWLEETKILQEGFFGAKFEDFDQARLEQWLMTNAYALEDELHEATDEVSWKPWASAEFFNREAFIGEMVDLLHFAANMLAGAQCTDEELNEAYLEKMERNRKRQREGYTGTDKCERCKRAADDVKAHGGYMKHWDGMQHWIHKEGRDPIASEIGYGCNVCFGTESDDST